jgi:hypothetical protein
MSNYDKSWEQKLSAYELDIDIPASYRVPEEELDTANSYLDFGQSKPQPASHTEEPVEDPTQPEPMREEEPATNPRPIVSEETPQHIFPPLTADEMKRLQTQLDEGITAITPLHDQTQRMIDDHEDIRLPKGLRTTARHIADTVSVLTATKAIIDIFLELGVESLYQIVDDNGLKTATGNAIITINSHVPTMQEGLDDIEQVLDEGYDRPSTNLRMRIVKGQAQVMQSLASLQAQALAKTIEAIPLENGALRLLCIIEEKGDETVMDSIDRTMEIAGHLQAPVADAPAMLDAVLNDDQETVDEIISHMLLDE